MTGESDSPPGFLRVAHIMSMPVVVDVRDPLDDRLAEAVFRRLRDIEARFSVFRSDSDVSRINDGDLAVSDAHPEVRAALDACARLHAVTDGYFDARRPDGSVDPSGYVKGWAIAQAAALLRDAGARNFAVNAGGDMQVQGGALPLDHWRVGIRHPADPGAVAGVVTVRDAAVATSGAYERGTHVRDPHTGAPATALRSVTIVGPDITMADAFATAAFAMGSRAMRWVATLRHHEAMLISDEDVVRTTPGFPLTPAGG